MQWRLIIEYFGTNIHHIDGVDNIVDDTLSILTYTPSDKYESYTEKDQCFTNELFAIGKVENKKYCFLLNLFIVQREQKKKLINMNPKLSTYISYQGSGYSMQAIDNVDIIFYDKKIYVPQSLHIHVLDWHHFCLNHPSGSRLAKIFREVCSWKVFLRKRNCLLSCAILVNSSKRVRLFMEICHLRIFKN